MRKRRPKRSHAISLETNIRYAVVHLFHQEVYSANHRVIGEAFNSRDEDYIPTTNIVVVATEDDHILGVINRDGSYTRKQPTTLPRTIWSGAPHPFFDPNFKNNV